MWYCLKIHCVPQCADEGYHLSLERVMQAYMSSRWRSQQNLVTGLQQLQGAVSKLEQSQDRDTLLQDHYNTFSMPLRFTYQPHEGDEVCSLILICILMILHIQMFRVESLLCFSGFWSLCRTWDEMWARDEIQTDTNQAEIPQPGNGGGTVTTFINNGACLIG